MNNKTGTLESSDSIDSSKRDFLKGAVIGAATVATSGLATRVLAGEKEVKFPLIPSQLGLDAKYRQLEEADSPIGALFSFAEQEWIKNATPVFKEETGLAWTEEMLPRLISGKFSDYDIQDLREFCPQFLTKCAVGVYSEHPKYGSLWSVGSFHISEKLTAGL
jgi:hypothetical protein